MPDVRNRLSIRTARIAVLLVVTTMIFVAHRAGVFEQLGGPARLKQTLLELGSWGYLAFIVAFALIQPFGIPGTVFVLAASLVWPWPAAFGLSLAGAAAASVVGFSFARFVARDWVRATLPARFRRYDDALAKRAFTTVVLLRFAFLTHPVLHAFLGVSKVRASTHLWGSLAGYALPFFVVSFFGAAFVEMVTSAPAWVWAGAGAVAAIGVMGAWRVRRRARQRRPPERHLDASG